MASVPPYDAPFPSEVCRDLLGVVRGLYAAYVELGPAFDDQRWKLRAIGAQLNTALERGTEAKPGTFRNRCAWLIADQRCLTSQRWSDPTSPPLPS